MRFLRDRTAIETSEVAVIIAVVVLVAYGAYQLLGAASHRWSRMSLDGYDQPAGMGGLKNLPLPAPFGLQEV